MVQTKLKIYSIFFFLLTFSLISAENIIWGNSPDEGEFSGGIGEWTTQHSFCASPLGNSDWHWDAEGSVVQGGLILEDPTINSPTVANGAMVFLYDTDVDNQRWYHSELISPVIDLSSTNKKMYLRFYELVASLNACGVNAPATYVEISTDGGVHWQYRIDANPTLGQQEIYNGERLLLLPMDIVGESNVKIKFVFSGDYFFWVVDDVVILERPDHDLKLDELFFGVPPNAMTPKSQLVPLNFVTSYSNCGLAMAEDIHVSIELTDTTEQVTFLKDSLYLETLAADSMVETVYFSTNYLLPEEERDYVGRYRVRSAHSEELDADNELTFRFSVTDTVFAKEFGRTRFITTGSGSKFAYGNCFYVPNGEGWAAAKIAFGMRRPVGGELLNKVISVELYRWFGASQNDDDIISPDEIENVGFGYYTITGEESQNEIIEVPLAAIGGDLSLQDDSWYLALVRYDYNTNEKFYINASDRIDYYPNYEMGVINGTPNYSTVVQFGNTNNLMLDRFSFGFNIVPVVRLYITSTVGVTANLLPLVELKVSPNPTKDLATVSFNAVEPLLEVRIKLVDVTGKIVANRHYKKIYGTFTVNFQMDNLPVGIYELVITSGNRITTRKLLHIR